MKKKIETVDYFDEWFNKWFFVFLGDRIDYKLLREYMVYGIGRLYDGHGWESSMVKPDPSISKEEAVERLNKLLDEAEYSYKALFNDYWMSDEHTERIEVGIRHILNKNK